MGDALWRLAKMMQKRDEKELRKMTTHLAKWTGSDGKRYVTDDPDVVRRRVHAEDRDYVIETMGGAGFVVADEHESGEFERHITFKRAGC